MKIDVVLRTHNKRDIHSHTTEKRYCGSDKSTLIYKCIQSLVNSVQNFTSENSEIKAKYYWYDDHSSSDCIEALHKLFTESKCSYEYIALEIEGWNSSALAQFERGRDSDADLVYFVEDDYLHFPEAIKEMVSAYELFKYKLNDEVAIHPFDDPDNYKPRWIIPTKIVYGHGRRWRTNQYTTFTFMCNPEIIRKNWSIFYTLATEYGTEWGEAFNIHEGTTINKIWRESVCLFTPIPSVALHMQYKDQMDPYIDWKKLWDSINIDYVSGENK